MTSYCRLFMLTTHTEVLDKLENMYFQKFSELTWSKMYLCCAVEKNFDWSWTRWVVSFYSSSQWIWQINDKECFVKFYLLLFSRRRQQIGLSLVWELPCPLCRNTWKMIRAKKFRKFNWCTEAGLLTAFYMWIDKNDWAIFVCFL